MRDRAYRYYQNKRHNDRTASDKSRRCHHPYKKTVKRISRPNSIENGIEWKPQDKRSITGLKSQIDEHNGLEKAHRPSARRFPTYLK